MSITDELREWFKDRFFMANGWQEIHDIADRIDAEHESKVSYWQGASHKDGYDEGFKDGYDEGFASADDWLAQHEDAMAEHGWIRLPKDADGEYTNADDEMFWKEDGDSAGRVTAIGVGQRAGWVWTLLDGCNVSTGHEAFRLRHYHAPTVEDVLREFANEVYADADNEIRDRDFLCAKYAKRLTLAGGEDA